MPFLMAALYDRVMAGTEAACLASWRRDLLTHASGDVLEIGAGTGANLPHYPADVRAIELGEPDPHMRRRLASALRGGSLHARATVRELDAGALPHPDETFDTVVSTLVLCTVPDLDSTLREIARVLRPGGQLLYLEHVGAPRGTSRRKWQGRLEPIWKHVAGGCHLTRETLSAIEAAGLVPMGPKREEMRRTFPWIKPSVRGRAIKPGAAA